MGEGQYYNVNEIREITNITPDEYADFEIRVYFRDQESTDFCGERAKKFIQKFKFILNAKNLLVI